MDIDFKTKKLAEVCNQEKKARGRHGPVCAKKIMLRMEQLAAATSLADIFRLPGARCHPLDHDYAGCFAVDLEHPKRLIFKPYPEKPAPQTDGSVDWAQVTGVMVIGIEDYH